MRGSLSVVKSAVLIAACFAVASSPAAGQVTASLSVAPEQDESLAPYRRATLALTNDSPSSVETVELRAAGGGPAVRCPLAAAPGGQAARTVALPAIWLVQSYRVKAMADDGRTIGEASADITWPAELSATDDFIDASLAGWSAEPLRWPAAARRNLLILLGLMAVALAATLLIRRPLVRALAALLLAGATTALLALVVLPAMGPPTVVRQYELLIHDAEGKALSDSFAVIAARRTGPFVWQADRPPQPVYFDGVAAAADDSVLRPEEGTLTMTVRAGEVRIVRPGVRTAAGGGGPVHPGGIVWKDDSAQVTGVYVPPDGGGILIRDDRVWLIEPLPTSGRTMAATSGEGRSLWSFLDSPGHEVWDADLRRLLMTWREKYRRGGQAYAIVPAGDRPVVRLEVVPLTEQKEPVTTTVTSSR